MVAFLLLQYKIILRRFIVIKQYLEKRVILYSKIMQMGRVELMSTLLKKSVDFTVKYVPVIWLPVLLLLFLRAFTCRTFLEIKIWWGYVNRQYSKIPL